MSHESKNSLKDYLKRKGQIFTSDFSASIFIFFIIVSVAFMSWNMAVNKVNEFDDYGLMQEKSQHVSDILIRTPGYPLDWNSTSVGIIGLSTQDQHVLDPHKLSELKLMDYDSMKSGLGISRYDFSLKFLSTKDLELIRLGGLAQGKNLAIFAKNETGYLPYLNDSKLDWDLYWASNNPIPSNTANNIYEGNKTYMFEKLIDNLSNYSLVVAESPEVNSSDISNSDELESWVKNGGIYLQDERGEIIDLFNLNRFELGGSEEGEVLNNIYLLNSELASGDNVSLKYTPYYFTDPDQIFINKTGESLTKCLACGWNYSEGEIYYLGDAKLSESTVSQLDLASNYSFNPSSIFGHKLVYGLNLTKEDPENVVVNRRDALLDKKDSLSVRMRFELWN